MVRVLGCAVFKSQDVFSTTYEPVSVCSSDNRLFVATEQCFIHVYDLTKNGCPEIHKFPTASRVIQIHYTEIGNTFICFEREHTIKHVRVYNGWQITSELPMKVRFTGRALNKPAEDDEPAQMVVSEIQLKNSPSCIALDPITAQLMIVVGHHIMVYTQNQVINNHYKLPITEYHCHYEIPIEMKIESIALCENYIAVSSKREIQVLKLSNQTDKVSKQDLYQSKSKDKKYDKDINVKSEGNDEEEHIDDNGIYTDKNYFVWTPELLDPLSRCDSHVNTSPDPRSRCDSHVNTVWYKGLHSCKFNPGEEATENITKDSHCKQVNVKRPEGVHVTKKPLPQVTCCLYQVFKSSDVPLHSLQFIPLYNHPLNPDVTAAPPGGGADKQLSSLCLYVSGSRQGYLYQIIQEFTLLATYSYSGACSQVITTDYCIHVVTSTGLETYLSMAVPATLHDMIQADNRHDTLPPVNLETCLLSHQPFIGVQAATCTNQCVVLMSKVEDAEWGLVSSHWSIYCLKTVDAVSLYHEMMETGSRYQQLSPHAYLHLLQQAHLLIRSARLVDSRSHDGTLDDLIKDSARSLAEEYASPESSQWYLTLPYFRLSGMTAAEIITTQLQKGFVRTLDGGISRGFQHWLEQTMLQKDVDKDKDLMEELDNISKILPKNLRGFLPANIKQIQVI